MIIIFMIEHNIILYKQFISCTIRLCVMITIENEHRRNRDKAHIPIQMYIRDVEPSGLTFLLFMYSD